MSKIVVVGANHAGTACINTCLLYTSCKAVTYTLDEELSELVFCHCSFCRKATASAYTVNAKVSSKNLVLHGNCLLYTSIRTNDMNIA